MREFEQMEMQFFVALVRRKNGWILENTAPEMAPGFRHGSRKYRYHEHTKLAHYADAAFDIEFQFPVWL